MSDNLFTQLEALCRLKRPVLFQPGTEIEYFDSSRGTMVKGTTPMEGVKPIRFEITSITANEALEAEGMITASAPAIMQEQPAPQRVGTVMTQVGYDYEHPEYLKQLRKEQPMRDAAICILGCPALRETTPGETLREKADSLVKRVPGAMLVWMAEQVSTMAALTAVGEKEVADFLAHGSGATQSSQNTKGRSRTGGRKKSSKDSTDPTSTTN
jgi:hypothetical protein